MAAALDALVPEAEQTARRKILASGVVSPCPTASRNNRPAVIEDPDIFRAARLLINKHGNDAAIRAAQRADGLLNGGEMDGAAVWRQILEAIEELTRGRRDGEALN
jgi:hypothetical protein